MRAILFDFDGTLAPNLDLPDMRRQVIELTQSYAVPEPVWTNLYMVEMIDAARAFLQDSEPVQAAHYYDEAHQLITDIELAAAAKTQPFPGMTELLVRLADEGFRLGIVTRNCKAAVLQTFPDLPDLVHHISARGDCEYLKPDPRHVQHCLDTIQASTTNAMIIGDGHMDMQVGRALKLNCVGVTTGSSDAEKLREHGAHHILDGLTAHSDLAKLFN